MIYLQLFWSFLQVGLFSIGGGYAAMPLIESQVVQGHGWLTMNEFTDLITIAEMTPGPIAVNSATFVGIRIAGIGGALVATLGCITPSLIIVSVLAKIYYKYKGAKALDSVADKIIAANNSGDIVCQLPDGTELARWTADNINRLSRQEGKCVIKGVS